MMTATNLKPTLNNNTADAGVAAEITQFGTVEVNVPDALATRVGVANKIASNFQKATKEWLPKLRTVGGALNELRELYKSDTEFGQKLASDYKHLADLPRQFRSELMEIDRSWDEIEAFRTEGKITSYSVGVIMKQLRKARKPEPEAPATPTETAKGRSNAPSMSMDEERDELAKGEKSLKDLSEAEYAQIVFDQIAKSGMDLGEFKKAFAAVCKGAK